MVESASRVPAPAIIESPGHGALTAGAADENISFKWVFPNAKQVCIAGSFNHWQPTATPLKNCGDGNWLLELALKPGRYEYRFVVDGKWMDDPLSYSSSPNPFGGHNSVLVVNVRNGKN